MKRLLIILSICILYMIFSQNSLAQNIDNRLGGQYDDVGFYIINSVEDTLFTCLGDGKVGIGTKSPMNILDVIAPSGGDGISVSNSSGYYRILMSIAGGDYGFIELHDTDQENNAWFSPYGCSFYYPNSRIGISADGALFEGTLLSGEIPTQGAGTRMMWYPAKAAFRAGYVSGDQWDDENIGPGSTAMGANTTASGELSTAMGLSTTASGLYSIAMGDNTTASGGNSTAMGWTTTARGNFSTAMGRGTTASGDNSTAMGWGSTASGDLSTAIGGNTTASGDYSRAMGVETIASGNYSTAMGYRVETQGIGSFIIGDASTTTKLTRDGNNTFFARFNGGYRLYTNSNGTIGVYMNNGDNSWSPLSDSTKKENFKLIDSEEILKKISKFKLGTWNFIGQDPNKHRHYGPMAQDFYAAFGNDGIGTIGNDTTIASADFDGINFIAIQALEKRTTELQKENQMLKEEIKQLKSIQLENDKMKEHISLLNDKLNTLKEKIDHYVYKMTSN